MGRKGLAKSGSSEPTASSGSRGLHGTGRSLRADKAPALGRKWVLVWALALVMGKPHLGLRLRRACGHTSPDIGAGATEGEGSEQSAHQGQPSPWLAGHFRSESAAVSTGAGYF